MILGTVTGHLHSTINHPFYDGRTLLLVEGTGARQVMGSTDGPVRSVIVGIIDYVFTR